MTTNNKCSNTLDPVQGLVDYVNDIKPYHTKVIEVLVEYVYGENVKVTIKDEPSWVIDIARPPEIPLTNFCSDGYSMRPFGDSALLPVISPNQSIPFESYPAINSSTNSFTVPGDRAGDFIPGAQIDLIAFVENYEHTYKIFNVNPGPSGTAYFVVEDPLNTFSTYHPTGSPSHQVETLGTPADDNRPFTIVSSSNSLGFTTVNVLQAVLSTAALGHIGLVRTIGNVTGTYTISQSVYNAGSIDSWPGYPDPLTYVLGDDPHTVITVVEPLATPTYTPLSGSPLSLAEMYTVFVRPKAIAVENVLSYSNFLANYNPFGPTLSQTPDEGLLRKDITGIVLSTFGGSPYAVIPDSGKFVVSGNLQVSNIFVGDIFRTIGSTGNDGIYTITSLSYDIGLNETTLGVAESVLYNTIDGLIEVDIPSNVFIVDGNHTSRFIQGSLFDIYGGLYAGTYTTLSSDFVNGKTRIRPTENIIDSYTNYSVVDTTTGFVVNGNLTSKFTPGTKFNIVGSSFNDGSYTVDSSVYVMYSGSPSQYVNQTVVIPVETFLPTADGKIYLSTAGVVKEHALGYSDFADFCSINPEGLVRVKFDEYLKFEGLGLDLRDNMIVYNLENSDKWGYELPLDTILSSTTPIIVESASAPVTPSIDDLWFNTVSGILNRWTTLGWRKVTTVLWLDTNTNLMYYRTKDKFVDTGWILSFANPPGLNDVQPAVAKTILFGQEIFLVADNSGTPQSTFILGGSPALVVPSTGSPATPDENLIRVFINNVPASFTLDNASQFTLTSFPSWEVGDIVTAKVYDQTQTETNANVISYNLEPHKVYHRDVTVYSGSPQQNAYVLFGGNYIHRFIGENRFDAVKVTFPGGILGTQRAASFPIVSVDGGTQTIVINGTYDWLFTSGRIFSVRTSGNNFNDFQVVSSITSGSPTITTITVDYPTLIETPLLNSDSTPIFQNFSRDLGVIIGAVYDPIVDGSPTGTDQVKTYVVPTTPILPTTEGISYTWVGPVRFEIELLQQNVLTTSIYDQIGAADELFTVPYRYDIIATNRVANTITIHYDDPLLLIPVSLTDSFTPGTIFTVAGSYGENNPSSQQTNDAMYVVKSVIWDDPTGSPGTGDTIIEIQDLFDDIPPYNNLTVVSITNSTGSPSLPQIQFAGDVVSLLRIPGTPINLTTVFYIEQPIVSTTPLLNVLTIVDVSYSGGITTATVDQDFINVAYTGTLGIIDGKYRADIFFDATNTTFPWVDGSIVRDALRIDHFPEGLTATTFSENLDFGWGTTYRWEIIGMNGITNTVYVSGNVTSVLDVNDRIKVISSIENNGDYNVVSFGYNIGLNRTEIVIIHTGSPSNLPIDPVGSPKIYGYLQLDDIDITNWFQYLIREAKPSRGSPLTPTNVFEVYDPYSTVPSSIQINQQFRVLGTTNDGIFTVLSSPVYNSVTNTTDIPVLETITNNERGGWVESYRDQGIRLIFEDRISTNVGENATGAVLLTSGNIIDAWDYKYFDIGGWDENLGTVLNLYSN